LGFVVGIHSTITVPPNAIDQLCQAVVSHPVLATSYLVELAKVLSTKLIVNQKFPTTLNYIGASKNIVLLTTNCSQFFVGLQNALSTDIQANLSTVTPITPNFAQYIDNVIARVLANAG
jgi:hypothetical protein